MAKSSHTSPQKLLISRWDKSLKKRPGTTLSLARLGWALPQMNCSIATFGYKRVAYFHHFELFTNIDLHDHTTNVTTAVLRRAAFGS